MICAGRQFELFRQPAETTAQPKAHNADALLYVTGSTPLHLATTVYDRFDGVTWHEVSATSSVNPPLVLQQDHAWIKAQQWGVPSNGEVIPDPADSAYTDEIPNQIIFGTLESESIPTPAHLDRFKVAASTIRDSLNGSSRVSCG